MDHAQPNDTGAAGRKATAVTGGGSTTVADAVCTACGCACDDIELTVEHNRLVAATRACERGTAWFLQERLADLPLATIGGQTATLDEAVEEAARILAAARYPLVYGLSAANCEAQRFAVAIADWIGGNVDSTTSTCDGPMGMAFHGVGEMTCTLGEIRHRGDLVIFWGADPHETHPRHAERFSLAPTGIFVPRGRADRTCVVVDVRKTKTADDADLVITIKSGADFESLWTLRALAQGIALDAEEVEEQTGVPLATWQKLFDLMKRAKFGVFMFGSGLTTTRGRFLNAEAVLALTRDMNAFTRFVCVPLRGPGNVAGADNVLLWTTGFPFGVNFALGYPRFNPGEYTAEEVLARREADAALIVASDPIGELGPAARAQLAVISTICVGAAETTTSRAARVAIHTATPGIETAGTVYRMDEVPLPLRKALDTSYPTDVDVLSRIENRVKELRGCGTVPARAEKSRRV